MSYRKVPRTLQDLFDFRSPDHHKAVALQQRIVKHRHEWLVFLDAPRVPPTNNLVERALRPLVVFRKRTFGHRTAKGASRMAQSMTVQETAKRHGARQPTASTGCSHNLPTACCNICTPAANP